MKNEVFDNTLSQLFGQLFDGYPYATSCVASSDSTSRDSRVNHPTVRFVPVVHSSKDDADNMLFEVELPGVQKENVSLTVDHRNQARLQVQASQGTRNYRSSILVPRSHDAELSTAKLENGLLTVRVPQKENIKAQSKSIMID